MTQSKQPTVFVIDPQNWYPRLAKGIDPSFEVWQSGYISLFGARDKFIPIDINMAAPPPSLAEADIIFIDMGILPFRHEPSSRQNIGTDGPWANMANGRIDTRAVGFAIIKATLDRSISSGAVCIVFVSNQGTSNLRLGRSLHGVFVPSGDVSDVWDQIPALELVDSERDMGTELNSLPSAGSLSAWFTGTFDTKLQRTPVMLSPC